MSEANSTTCVEYREISRFVGYRFGDDGNVWSRWKNVSHGYGGWKSVLSDSWKFRKSYVNLKTGYRLISLKTTDRPRQITLLLHRLILEAFRGPCPSGMEACHEPGIPRSNCELRHLRWDTLESNRADKVEDGTDSRGEKNPSAKLTREDVIEIRRLLDRGMTQRAIAVIYGVNRATIGMIHLGKTWKHVKDGVPIENDPWTD